MKTIQLTQGKVALVDDADFGKVAAHKWYATFIGKHWYAGRNIRLPDGKRITQRMHRFILGIEYGNPLQVDHKDRENTLDNRRSNLRVTLKQNSQNVGIPKHNTSGFKGVTWDKRGEKWHARVRVNGKLIHLGLFSTAELAARAYDAAAVQYHGSFACTNAMLGLLKKSPQSVTTMAAAA